VKITAETAPHYIGATDAWCNGYDSNCRVNPPLREEEDRLACIKGLCDGTLDAIATDHAPHHEDEKRVEFHIAASGIVGFETAFAICNTPFYQRYSYLHYTWFSAAMLFLETGYVGLVLYGMFFVLVFQHAFRRRKVGGNVIYCQLAMMMVVVSGILLFYNSSLRTEAAYMIYFVFAAPFICGTGRVPPKSGHKQRLRA